MKKKLLALVALLTVVVSTVFGLTACQGEKTDWDYIQSRGKIVVGFTDYPPLDIKDNKGNLSSGFDYELAKLVAKELGVNVEFREITWSQKVMDINSKKVDVLWNGMTVSDELKDKLSFSNPYLKNVQVAVVAKDSAINTLDDIKAIKEAGKIAAEEGSAGDAYIADKLNAKSPTLVAAQKDLFTEIEATHIKVGILDSVFARYYTNLPANQNKFKVIELPGADAETFAIGFRKEDKVFVNKVNEAIKSLNEKGEIDKLAEKYGLVGDLVK